MNTPLSPARVTTRQSKRFCLSTVAPNWRPGITLVHGARDVNHVLVDATCPSVITRDALPAACRMPLAAAIAAAAMAHAKYGDVHPRTVLPCAVEHAGGIMINKEGMPAPFFRMTPREIAR